eukprot:1346594-Lingulodinium_polyedra.AAC.1
MVPHVNLASPRPPDTERGKTPPQPGRRNDHGIRILDHDGSHLLVRRCDGRLRHLETRPIRG